MSEEGKVPQAQYVSALSSDNAKAKSRIASLKAEIEKFESKPQEKGSSPLAAKPDIKAESFVNVQEQYPTIGLSMSKGLQQTGDSPNSEVVLSTSQEMQIQKVVNEASKAQMEKLSEFQEGMLILQDKIKVKGLKREELARLYEEKKQGIDEAEKEIKKELATITQSIDTDVVYYNKDQTTLKREIEALQKKIDKCVKKSNEYIREKEKNEKLMVVIQREADESHNYKVLKFHSSMAPLEDAARTIELQKSKTAEKLKKEQEDLRVDLDMLGMMKEDLNGREVQRMEMAEKKKGLVERMSEFKENYREESKLFFNELETEDKLNNIQIEKKRMEERIKSNEKSRLEIVSAQKENEELTAKLQGQVKASEDAIQSAYAKGQSEILKLESDIDGKLKKVDSEPLAKLIFDQAKQHGISTERALFLLQKEAVEEEVNEMMKEQAEKEEGIASKILELSAEMKASEGDPNKRGSTKIKVEQVKMLEGHLANLKAQYETKLECVEKWRIQMKAKHKIGDEVADNEIQAYMLGTETEYVEALIKLLLAKFKTEEEKKDFERTFLLYNKKLRDREQTLQKLVAKTENIRNHIMDLQGSTQGEDKKLLALEQESMKLKSDFNNILQAEKAFIKQRDESKKNIESGLGKQGDQDYKEFLKKNDDIFKSVKKAYGVKAADKIKVEHRKEIGVLANVKQIERRNIIREVHLELLHINSNLASSETIDELKENIRLLKDSCSEKEARVKVMTTQLTAILEAEKQVSVQIEELLKKKKAEFEQALSLYYRKKNFDIIKQRAEELKGLIESKISKYTGLKEQLENLKKTVAQKRESFAIHKIQQRMKLEATQRQMKELQKVLKAHLHTLEKEIGEYGKEITDDRKKVGALNLKLNSSIVAMKLVKPGTLDQLRDPQEASLGAEENESHTGKIESEEVIAESAKAHKEPPSHPTHGLTRERLNPTNEQLAISEKHSVLANPSESGSAPRYGSINVDLADLNVTGSERDKIIEVPEAEVKDSYCEKKGEMPKDNFVYSSIREHLSKYKVDSMQCSVKEVLLFESMRNLLEGMHIYRKYTTQNLLKVKGFDPLLAQKNPPENCGYGKRFMVYNPAKSTIEFRTLKKPFVEDVAIPLADLKAVIIPSETTLIIKTQRTHGTLASMGSMASIEGRSMEFSKDLEEAKKEPLTQKLDKLGRSAENEAFREQCMTVTFYPYSLLTKDKRLELVAETYTVFKYSIQAINQIIANVGLMKSLNKRLITIPQAKEEEQILESEKAKEEIIA